jgi:galactokinase
VRLCGFEVLISSSLPLGGGLGSSASLEVALLRALDQAFSLSLDPVAIARIAHRAETGLVGAPVGIMDQMAASLADSDEALFLDTMTLAFARVPFPRPAGLIVIHSGVAHRHAEGEYRTRRRECEEAAQRLGVDTLRDISLAEFRPERLPPPLDRRGRHVLAENERVVRAREALQAGDLVLLGRLMNESHQSMRDDFEVSTPEIDSLVGIAQAEEGVFGARLTGGGFGGSIVAVTSADAARRRAQRIADAYAKRAHVQPQILIPDLSAGA